MTETKVDGRTLVWLRPGYREKQRAIHKKAWNVPQDKLSQTEYDEFCRSVILQSNKTCGMCGEQGNYPWKMPAKSRDLEVHHLDGNHSNNNSENVIAIHHGCHASIHLALWFYKLGHKPTSKSNQYGAFKRHHVPVKKLWENNEQCPVCGAPANPEIRACETGLNYCSDGCASEDVKAKTPVGGY